MSAGHRRRLAALTAAAVATSVVLAQVAAVPAAPPGPTLHRLWVDELLDADAAAAAAGYRTLALDDRAAAFERLIAGVRLLELQRLGVAPADPIPLLATTDVPQGIREAGATLGQARGAYERLAERARTDPAALFQQLQDPGDRGAGRFNPRPLVPMLQAHLQEQGFGASVRERRRLLLDQLQSAIRRGDRQAVVDARRQLRALEPDGRDPQQNTRSRALLVLQHVLRGEPEQAAALRADWFPGWQPGAAEDPPEAGVRRALRNLQQVLSDPDLPAGERAALTEMRDRLQELARRSGPRAALDLLDQVPFYRERLLRVLRGR